MRMHVWYVHRHELLLEALGTPTFHKEKEKRREEKRRAQGYLKEIKKTQIRRKEARERERRGYLQEIKKNSDKNTEALSSERSRRWRWRRRHVECCSKEMQPTLQCRPSYFPNPSALRETHPQQLLHWPSPARLLSHLLILSNTRQDDHLSR